MKRDVVLMEGPHHEVRLPLAAHKHKTIHCADGAVYARMPRVTRTHWDGSESNLYLWDGWWAAKLAATAKAKGHPR